MTIAKIIADQIGGGALYMIGAKQLTDMGNGLRMKVMRNAKRVTHVLIELDPSDTYTVTFNRQKRAPSYEVETMGVVEGVYVDMLKSIIEDGTGLALSL